MTLSPPLSRRFVVLPIHSIDVLFPTLRFLALSLTLSLVNGQAAWSIESTRTAADARELLENAQQRLLNPEPSIDSEHDSPWRVPASETLDHNVEFDAYRLGPGDSFYVNVEGFPEANFQATLDLEGNVLVPLVGIRSFQGLTLDEAIETLQHEMERLFVSPVVDVTLVTRRPVYVTLLGEVFRPGFYPLSDPQLTSALLSAGGVTRLANLTSIQVRRTVRDRTGQPAHLLEENFDLFSPLANGQALPQIRLEDGDVIIIPALTAAESTQYDRTMVAQSNLAHPAITIRVLSYAAGIGQLELPSGSTFLDAITAIGPTQQEVNIREIGLIRFDPDSGQVITQELNAKKALLGDMSQNIVLEDHDVLVINRSLLARITHHLGTITRPFRDVLGFLLFFDTFTQSTENLLSPIRSSN